MAKKSPPGPPTKPRIPFALLFRMFAIGMVAVIAAAYGIYRYYTVPRASMLVPVPSATELPAPELVPAD